MQDVEDEWPVVVQLLPKGWRQAARDTKAFSRARGLSSPACLLRALLFHAVSHGTFRSSAAQLRKAKLVSLSEEALRLRLRASASWLAWLAGRLAERFRRRRSKLTLRGLHPRALDSTTIQGPASTGTQWRLHYSLDLLSLDCDWHQLTDAHGSELLERAQVSPGDVLLADKNFLRPAGVRAVSDAKAFVLVRMRWTHPALLDHKGRELRALNRARTLRINEVGDWPVTLREPNGPGVKGRLVVLKLPLPLARKAQRKAERQARKKRQKVDPRTLEAARYVMLFTTLSEQQLSGEGVLQWYRFRWQVELAFKRHKQLLKLGKLPHSEPETARAWILAKLVVALLLETLYRQAETISPWGYERAEKTESMALDDADETRPGASALPSTKAARRSVRAAQSLRSRRTSPKAHATKRANAGNARALAR